MIYRTPDQPFENEVYIMRSGNEEQCAKCGIQMSAGEEIVDVDTVNERVPFAMAEWATIHKTCLSTCEICEGDLTNAVQGSIEDGDEGGRRHIVCES